MAAALIQKAHNFFFLKKKKENPASVCIVCAAYIIIIIIVEGILINMLTTHVNGEIRPWENAELWRLFWDVAKKF
jgi:heme/copper-type cytochrome/quinol oxidase subunit 4